MCLVYGGEKLMQRLSCKILLVTTRTAEMFIKRIIILFTENCSASSY